MDAGGIRKDERDPYAVVIVMPEDLLFKRGESEVGPGGQNFLNKFVPALSGIVCSGPLRTDVARVVVEGHTDSVWSGMLPVGTDGPQQNLELSQKRSIDVVRRSLSSLTAGTERDCFRRLLSASGRGQEELLLDLPGDDSRQRRVVYKIRTQQSSAPDLADAIVKGSGS